MAGQTFTVENREEFQRKLETLMQELGGFHDKATTELEKGLSRILLHLGRELGDYPPPPSGSTYRRTDTLGRLWTVARPQFRVAGTTWEGRLGNATPYGPYVQDDERQAWMHTGRWRTVGDVVRDQQDVIKSELDRVGATLVEDIASAVNAA